MKTIQGIRTALLAASVLCLVYEGGGQVSFRDQGVTGRAWPAMQRSAGVGWQLLPSFAPGSIPSYDIAADQGSIVVFYDAYDPSINLDVGIIRVWEGSSWRTLGANITNECNSPAVAVRGASISAAYANDSQNWGWWVWDGSGSVYGQSYALQRQFGMYPAFAQERPYLCFACRYSGGNPTSTLLLHVISPWWPGTKADVDGMAMSPISDIDPDPGFTGTADGWYAVFVENSFLWVVKGYVSANKKYIETVGSGIRYSSRPEHPRIAVYQGLPYVFWTEGNGTRIYIGRYTGAAWELILGGNVSPYYFSELSVAADDSKAYFACIGSDVSSARVNVIQFNGTAFPDLPGPLEGDSHSTITSAHVGIYKGQPMVSFRENGLPKVLVLTGASSVKYEEGIPGAVALFQNYPNPFNPSTIIRYALPHRSHVALNVYNTLGQKVAELVNSDVDAGFHDVQFNAGSLASGVYFYRLQAGSYVDVKKLSVLK